MSPGNAVDAFARESGIRWIGVVVAIPDESFRRPQLHLRDPNRHVPVQYERCHGIPYLLEGGHSCGFVDHDPPEEIWINTETGRGCMDQIPVCVQDGYHMLPRCSAFPVYPNRGIFL